MAKIKLSRKMYFYLHITVLKQKQMKKITSVIFSSSILETKLTQKVENNS